MHLPKITDQPRDRPARPIPAEEREKHVILSLSVPSSSNVADTAGLVSAMFQFIDSLNKLNLRPETKAKLKKNREEVDKKIKDEAEKEAKEEVCLFLGRLRVSEVTDGWDALGSRC